MAACRFGWKRPCYPIMGAPERLRDHEEVRHDTSQLSCRPTLDCPGREEMTFNPGELGIPVGHLVRIGRGIHLVELLGEFVGDLKRIQRTLNYDKYNRIVKSQGNGQSPFILV